MPSFPFRVAVLTAVLLVAVVTEGSLKAQSGVPRAEAVGQGRGYYPQAFPMERMEVPVDPDKRLAPGDQVTIEIVEDRDGGLPKMITATGELDVQPLGRVKVSGKTTSEAEADIKRRLEADYYYKATVRLSIDRVSPTLVRSGIVNLYGEVRQVGPIELVSGESLRLSEAIGKAGGFGAWADDRKVELTRKSGQREVIDVKDIIRKGLREKDPLLEDGDRVFVPQSFFKK
jgi:protein involved in polysaccharide export with SLBB domain